jgi:hypothetical protein
MKESEVKKVVRKFFTNQRVKYYPTRGAGPDFLKGDGSAVETKGSGFDVKRSLNQFVRYGLTYTRLEIAVPCDTLTAVTLFALSVIEKSLEASGRQSVVIYLVARIGQTTYKIRVYASFRGLYDYVSSRFVEKLCGPADSELEQRVERSANLLGNMNKELSNILEEDTKSIMGFEVIL